MIVRKLKRAILTSLSCCGATITLCGAPYTAETTFHTLRNHALHFVDKQWRAILTLCGDNFRSPTFALMDILLHTLRTSQEPCTLRDNFHTLWRPSSALWGEQAYHVCMYVCNWVELTSSTHLFKNELIHKIYQSKNVKKNLFTKAKRSIFILY